MEFLLPLLGGALGAALINGLVAFYKIRKDQATEHSQWRRDERKEAYLALFDAIGQYLNACARVHTRSSTSDPKELMEKAHDAADHIFREFHRCAVLLPITVINGPVSNVLEAVPNLLMAAADHLLPEPTLPEGSFKAASAKMSEAIGGFRMMAQQDLQLASESRAQQTELVKIEQAIAALQSSTKFEQ